MNGKAFLCGKPGEEVGLEDLGSDQEEEEVARHTERRDLRYHPKGKMMPITGWAREEQTEAEEGKKREIRKLRKEKWA